jgi:hypothetical protein
MEQIAVDKARRRLEKATGCVKRMEDSRSFSEFESAWTDFLIALNSIHAALELGAKTNPQSRQWYGGKKTMRRKDPLLSYLHQARNADEHGIEPIAAHKPGGVKIGAGAQLSVIAKTVVNRGKASIKFHPIEGPGLVIIPPSAELIPVRNQFGNVFAPPTQHLRSILPDVSPLAIARIGFKYHEALVQAASRRIRK